MFSMKIKSLLAGPVFIAFVSVSPCMAEVNEVDSNFNVATPNITKSVTSSKVQSLGNELKLIGVIGFSLFAILVISSFVF